jgi:hypothetical protein
MKSGNNKLSYMEDLSQSRVGAHIDGTASRTAARLLAGLRSLCLSALLAMARLKRVRDAEAVVEIDRLAVARRALAVACFSAARRGLI